MVAVAAKTTHTHSTKNCFVLLLGPPLFVCVSKKHCARIHSEKWMDCRLYNPILKDALERLLAPSIASVGHLIWEAEKRRDLRAP